jgi:hypothetical protein
MRGAATLFLATLAVMLIEAGEANADPAALVEEIGTPRPGLQVMDSLSAGQMITLRPGERLVLDYLSSCTRETIVGGVVSIGAAESIVVDGVIKREKTECEGGKALLTADQASKSAVMVFREVKLGTASKPSTR